MKLTVGIGQFAPALGDVERNLAKIEELCVEAKHADAELLILPELALTGYTLKDMVPVVAQTLDSPIIRKLRDLSREVELVCGFAEESSDYRFYNAAAYFQNGAIRHVHRKVYLPTYGMFEEYRYFASGERIRSFDTPFGRAAILICEDLWHPSTSYITAQDGCDLLIVPSCSPARGLDHDEDLYSVKAWRTLNRMNAHFYGQYVAFANRIGYEDGVGFWGGSEIIAPDGELVARAEQFQPELLIATLTTEHLKRARVVSPLLRDERLDITLRELDRIQRQRMEP
ncbi:MAG: carbon-nitrogen hydrolase [Candidatus Poribacteria bacterium]|nr:carbon-nitrogen hydrolase [Candidatus Poribacteria bacterium]